MQPSLPLVQKNKTNKIIFLATGDECASSLILVVLDPPLLRHKPRRCIVEAVFVSCALVEHQAGLLQDLKQRDLLKDTLVIWGGEFGRTPAAQGGDGRNHNNKGYTTWMAGGGVRGGFSYGATDEHGYEAVAGKMHINDWHATILHLLGLDHQKLTYRYAGRDFRLTNVGGNVAHEILA